MHQMTKWPLRLGFVALVLLLVGEIVSACNIPVFRYALERWKSDDYEVVVFHDGELGDVDSTWLNQLENAVSSKQGTANATVIRIDLAMTKDEKRLAFWNSLPSKPELPYVAVRLVSPRGRSVDAWRGTLNEAAKIPLFDSPVRAEITKRLLNGHSIVWLMLKSGKEELDAPLAKLLKEQCQALESTIQLPEGIGVPGSELYSEVPLFVKFSLLEIDRKRSTESLMIHLLDHFHGELDSTKPLVAPVFGRGRLLEVIPGETLSPELIRDLTMFMSGACSCQVKDRNPGIDLLMSRNWDVELFGENGLRPPINSNSPLGSEPKLLTIPPGRKKK
jgi:hypothetical protein